MTVSKTIPTELLDSLLSGYQKPEDLIGEHGLLKQLTKALVERALEAEMTEHLGYAKHESVTNSNGNTRNGKYPEGTRAGKHSKATLANYRSKFPVTAIAISSRRSSPNIKPAGRVLMTKSFRSMPVA